MIAIIHLAARLLGARITLAPVQRDSLLERLNEVSRISHDFGYGLGDEMDELMDEYFAED